MKSLIEKLDHWQQKGSKLRIWWRSDDIAKCSLNFEKLLKIQSKNLTPLSLAVIPKLLTKECLHLTLKQPALNILQHGYSHQNFSNRPDGRVELGGPRPLFEILEQIQLGFEILSQYYKTQFLPIMVPPWHTIYPPLTYFFSELPIKGISLKEEQKMPLPHFLARLNVHIDFIQWHPYIHNKPKQQILEEILCFLNTYPQEKPLGLLTHHELHDEDTFTFLEQLIHLFSSHPACEWISSKDYLNLVN